MLGVLLVSSIFTYVLILRSFARTEAVEDLLADYADRVATRHFQEDYGDGGPSTVKRLTCTPRDIQRGKPSTGRMRSLMQHCQS